MSQACLSATAKRAYEDCRRDLEARLVPLPDQPGETAQSTLAALAHAAAGQPLSSRAAASKPLPDLDDAAAARLASLVRERLAGRPLAHLTGRQRFMGLEMLASPEALVPREETELLGRAALARLRAAAAARGEALVLDACTGSGNLALALAAGEPRARVVGADLSPAAVELARRNARHLGLADRASFVAGDLLSPFDSPGPGGGADLVTCNPPYISSARVDAMAGEIRDHEPRLAFDGGPFGIGILARLIDEAPRVLRPGGVLAFEVGLGQGPGIRKRLARDARYAAVEEALDAQGQPRAILATLAAPSGPR